jgi:hypothetical protein
MRHIENRFLASNIEFINFVPFVYWDHMLTARNSWHSAHSSRSASDNCCRMSRLGFVWAREDSRHRFSLTEVRTVSQNLRSTPAVSWWPPEDSFSFLVCLQCCLHSQESSSHVCVFLSQSHESTCVQLLSQEVNEVRILTKFLSRYRHTLQRRLNPVLLRRELSLGRLPLQCLHVAFQHSRNMSANRVPCLQNPHRIRICIKEKGDRRHVLSFR